MSPMLMVSVNGLATL